MTRKRLKPLQELFQTDTFGYVVIFSWEKVNFKASPSQQRFITEGGILLPLPAIYKELERESVQAREYLEQQS